VVFIVVRIAPVIACAHHIPFVALAVKPWVIHPIVLAVHYVVPKLHVFHNFRKSEQQGAEYPSRPQPTKKQQTSPEGTAVAHQPPNTFNVSSIFSTHLRCDIDLHRIQFSPKSLKLCWA